MWTFSNVDMYHYLNVHVMLPCQFACAPVPGALETLQYPQTVCAKALDAATRCEVYIRF